MDTTQQQNNLSDTHALNQLGRTRYGGILYNKHDRFIGRSIKLYGEYSEEETALFRQLCRTGQTVVEVGANIGVHTLPLARFVGNTGHIYAFEPQRLVFQTLCANMALNSITQTSCFNCGAGATKTTLKINELNYLKPANFGGYAIQPAETGIPLSIVRLDDMLGDKKVHFLKLDVEGMELEVLMGAEQIIKNSQPLIYLENDRINKSRQLIEHLWEKGYRLYWHKPRLYNPDNFFSNPENVFGNIVSINMLAIPNTLSVNVSGFSRVTDSGFHPMDKTK